MLPLFVVAIEKLSRAETMTWKKIRNVFKQKVDEASVAQHSSSHNQETGASFLKTVKIFSPQIDTYVEFKMMLDTGLEAHNLITLQVVHDLYMLGSVIFSKEPICICLNGDQLMSMGTLFLRWKGKRFRKIFTTVFHVVEGDALPWDVILGADTIHQHGILKFAGFGGATHILPTKTKGERSMVATRKREHKENATANDAKVDADIKAKEEAHRQKRSKADDLNSTNSASGHR